MQSSITSVGQVIQLAVAPVFLLTGLGAILSVMTARLARIVDHIIGVSRSIENPPADAEQSGQDKLRTELQLLTRRARLINWAITLCTSCALLICIVVAALFLGTFLAVDVSSMVALLFISAMLLLIGGLVSFLREMRLASAILQLLTPHKES